MGGGRRANGPAGLLAGAALIALIAVASAFALGAGGDADDRHLTAVFPRAPFIIPGLDVRAAGQAVGEVTDVELRPEGGTEISMRIEDEAAWPLAEGTQARLRQGGTVKYTARYVELDPPATGEPLATGAVIAGRDTAPGVEYDQVLNVFDPPTRRRFKAMLDRGGAALARSEDSLGRALDTAPPAVIQAKALMEDLGADPKSLHTLVRSGDRVVESIARSEPGAGELVSGAATTLDAIASQARELERTLELAAPAMRAARGTLARADHTLTAADEVVGRLAPGVREARALAPPLAGVLRNLVEVGPDARRTLATLREATPELNPFIGRTTQLAPRLESIGREAAVQLNCIRPYAPEIGAFGTTWISGAGVRDSAGYYVRAEAAFTPFNNATPITTPEAARMMPQLGIAFPRVPGSHANQPYFIPECGYTEDALDPSKDAEAVAWDPLARPIVGFEGGPPEEEKSR